MLEKYTQFKLMKEEQVERELIGCIEAINCCMGYLQALVDCEVITAEDFVRECEIMTSNMLEAEPDNRKLRRQEMMKKWLKGGAKRK